VIDAPERTIEILTAEIVIQLENAPDARIRANAPLLSKMSALAAYAKGIRSTDDILHREGDDPFGPELPPRKEKRVPRRLEIVPNTVDEGYLRLVA
jgi:hypothetical protein